MLVGIQAAAGNKTPELPPTVPFEVNWIATSGSTYIDFDVGLKRVTRTANSQNGGWAKASAGAGKNSGKWYAELRVVNSSNASCIGICNINEFRRDSFAQGSSNNAGAGSRVQYFQDGRKRRNSVYEAYGPAWNPDDIIGIKYDADARTLEFRHNGVDLGIAYTSISTTQQVLHMCMYNQPPSIEWVTEIPEANIPSGFDVWPAS